VLDLGLEAIQWNGKLANKNERIQAAQFLQLLESERNGKCKTEVVDEIQCSEAHKFMTSLTDVAFKPRKEKSDIVVKKTMYRISDASGKMVFSIISEGKAPKAMLDDADVFVIDTVKELFIYIGKHASEVEQKNSLSYAHEYLKSTTHPFAPVTIISDAKNTLPEYFIKNLD